MSRGSIRTYKPKKLQNIIDTICFLLSLTFMIRNYCLGVCRVPPPFPEDQTIGGSIILCFPGKAGMPFYLQFFTFSTGSNCLGVHRVHPSLSTVQKTYFYQQESHQVIQ